MLPRASRPVPLTIKPGDSVTVSITQQPQSKTQWLISMKNNTTGKTYEVTENYQSSMSSVEWIQEAPSSMGGQMPIDQFGTVSFSDGSAVKDGQNVNIAQSGAQAITMIGRNGQAVARTSALGSDGASFSVSHA
jgi:hypothetical protein